MSASDILSAQKLREIAQKTFPGVYRGRVESIDDPDRLGRVRLRVWMIHGDDLRTPTNALPWADIAEIGGGGYDYGSFNPPPVGSSVWVAFECGNPEHPVILGTFRGIPTRDTDNPNIFLTKDNKPETEQTWLPPDGDTETPKDVFDGVYYGDPHPTRRIWAKSYKGHTLLVEDGDGKEFLKIIDRAGQGIEFDCPVATEFSQGNAAQRGIRDAFRGDALPHEIMVDRQASVRIRDLSSQEIFLDASDQNERIVIRGRNKLGSIENKIILSSAKGKDGIKIEDTSGDVIEMDPNSDTPIVIRDSSGNAIVFNKDSGTISINSRKETIETVLKKSLTVDGLKYSEINGDEEKSIRGNKKTQIVGDLNESTLGGASVNIGGAIKAVINNLSPAGSEDNAIDVAVVSAIKGAIRVATQCATGNITLETLGADGSITLDAKVKGDIIGQTLLGNAKLLTEIGLAQLKTSLGQANVDGTTIHLGSTGASQPLIKGTIYFVSMTAFLAAFQVYLANIQPIADPLGTATSTMTGAITALITSLTTQLSTKTFTD